MNIWIDEITGEYKTRHDGKIYTRTSRLAALELVNDLLKLETVKFKNARLDRTLYAKEA